MKNYDYDLAKNIVNKLIELDVLQNAYMGMHEDWFWTSQTIWEEGEWKVEFLSNEDADKMYAEFIEARKNGLSMFLQEKDENGLSKFNPEYNKYDACVFGGLRGSNWGTPVVQVELKDGTEKTFNCFVGESEKNELEKFEAQLLCTSGCLSSPVQINRSDMNIETFNQ